MKKNDKLHTLIHSMDKSEKRYFQLFSNLSGDSKNKKYLKIFEVLHGMNQYDEDKFVESIALKGLPVRNLGSDKAYLYYQILKSLRKLNSSNLAKSEAREWLDISDVLSMKGLYDQALSACNKAIKVIDKFNLVSIKADALLTRRKILFYLNGSVDNEANKTIILSALKELEDFVKADYLYRNALFILKDVGKVRLEKEASPFNDIISDPLFTSQSDSLHAQIRLNQALAVIHFSKGETLDEYKMMKTNLEIMDTHPYFKEDNIYEYIIFFSHVLRLTKYVDYKEYEELLNGFFTFGEELDKNKRKAKAQIFSLGFSTEMVRLLEEGMFEKGIGLIPEIQKLNKKYGKLIPRSVYMTFEYKFAYFYFGLGNLTTALKHINLLINNYTESDRKDVFRYAKIFSLIIHFELGNFSLISYNIRSLYSFLKKRDLLYSSENTIIQCLKQLPRAKSKTDKMNILKQSKDDLMSHFRENERERNFLVFFDVITWIDSKLENKSFLEMKLENKGKNLFEG